MKMTLNRKITLLLIAVAIGILMTLVMISLYAFRDLSIASSTVHVQTAAEIVRVHLTESMIHGVIDKREQFLERLREIRNLETARVVRSQFVNNQFGDGLAREMIADDIEKQVLKDGRPRFELNEKWGKSLFRGTIPYVASARGTPNCLSCHEVNEGTVLGAVTIELSLAELKRQGLYGVLAVFLAVLVISCMAILIARRLILPVGDTASAIETVVHRALQGDFKGRITQRTDDDIGQIANHINRLLNFLDEGLTRITKRVSQLTGRPETNGDNQLLATIDMVDGLTDATLFKATIEEDETKLEIYQRFGQLLAHHFDIHQYTFYEVQDGRQMLTVAIDGEIGGDCHWCNPEILVRCDMCRAKRSGRPINGLQQQDICFAFQPQIVADTDLATYAYYCIPLIQSGAVGSVIQLVTTQENASYLLKRIPYIQVYLREMTPVLEAKKLTETLRESALRDAMTGLNNRRFLEEYTETLTAMIHRRKTKLALMMVDLDYFKMVNDTYGHDIGDAVLKELARILKRALRGSDLLIRFGGEEFLIILQDAEIENALAIAEKIRVKVMEFKFQVAGSILQKTISVGVAMFPDDCETFWQALKYADVALYRAKDEGRNRVVRFIPEMWKSTNDAY
jgi:diguanylate cyclase (GGDEF)-like protein